MKKIFLLPLLFMSAVLFAQPAFQWQKNYGGGAADSAYAIQRTSDGGYIVVGSTLSVDGDVTGNHGGQDFWVTKLNSLGAIVWKKSLGGTATEIPKCVQQTSDGGYIVAGTSNTYDDGDVYNLTRSTIFSDGEAGIYDSYGDPPHETWIVKLTSTGAISWSTNLHTSTPFVDPGYTYFFNNYANCIIQTTDGGYLLGGKVNNNTLVTKITSTGAVTWQKQMSFPGIEEGVTSMVQTPNGYTLVANGAGVGGYGGSDVRVFHLNNNGDSIWLYKFGGSGTDKGYSIQKTLDNTGFIIAGTSTSVNNDLAGAGNHGGNDYWILKLTNFGIKVWSKCYGGTNSDVARSVVPADDGNYYVCGSSYSSDMDVTDHHVSPIVSNSDQWVIKITDAGNLLWSGSYGGTANDDAYSLAKTPEGLIVAGNARSSFSTIVNKGSSDWYVIKLLECAIAKPTVARSQTFCSGATVASLAATGSAVKWYTTLTGGTALATASLLTTRWYYVTQTIGTCESARDSALITVNPTPVMPNAVNQNFCAGGATVANLVATGAVGAPIKWYNDISGRSVLAPATALINGNYYVTQSSNRGCESARRMISVAAGTPGLPNAANQNFCNSSTHTVAELVATGITGAAIKWYNTATGGAALAPTTALVSGNYYVSQAAGTCESARRTVLVTINVTPVMPTAAASQSFCLIAFPRVSNLSATGGAGAIIKWYNVAIGGTALLPTTLLTNGNYYVTQTSNRGCESSRRTVAVTIAACRPLAAQSTNAVSKASLYPNPAKGIVTVTIATEAAAGNANIRLMDMYGNVLLQQTAANNHGLVQKTIDISKLPNAVYVIKYVIGKESGEIKLQVTN